MTTNRIAVAVLTLAGFAAASQSASAQTIITPGITTGGYYTTPGTYYYSTPQYTYPSTSYYYSPGVTTTSYYASPSTSYYYPSTSYYPYTSSYYSPYSGYNSYYNSMYNYATGWGRGGRRR